MSDESIKTAAALKSPRAWLCGLLILAAPAFAPAQAAEVMPPGAYEVITETSMPHLEENLRYATTRERRCLEQQALASAFPILSHESLRGCRLDEESRRAEAVSYRLICDGGNGTTGTAQWQLGADRIRGTLEVKLGGKNMTFSQRITARSLGACTQDK